MASVHSLSKIPRKFSVIKKKSIFQPIIFFPQVAFPGAGVWNRKLINRPNRGHRVVEWSAITRASFDNTVRPDQSNRSSPNWHPPPTSRPDISSACLFYLFNKQNKLNLIVSLIFLATTRLYITVFKCVSRFRVSSSSSYRAGSTDIPDPLSPLLPIVHRPR